MHHYIKTNKRNLAFKSLKQPPAMFMFMTVVPSTRVRFHVNYWTNTTQRALATWCSACTTSYFSASLISEHLTPSLCRLWTFPGGLFLNVNSLGQSPCLIVYCDFKHVKNKILPIVVVGVVHVLLSRETPTVAGWEETNTLIWIYEFWTLRDW